MPTWPPSWPTTASRSPADPGRSVRQGGLTVLPPGLLPARALRVRGGHLDGGGHVLLFGLRLVLGGPGGGLGLLLGGLEDCLQLALRHDRPSARRADTAGDHRAAHAERRLLVPERVHEAVVAPGISAPSADALPGLVRVLCTAVHSRRPSSSNDIAHRGPRGIGHSAHFLRSRRE